MAVKRRKASRMRGGGGRGGGMKRGRGKTGAGRGGGVCGARDALLRPCHVAIYKAFYDFSLPITSPMQNRLLNRAYLLSLAACCSVASCSSAADIAVTYTFVADKHISEVRLF